MYFIVMSENNLTGVSGYLARRVLIVHLNRNKSNGFPTSCFRVVFNALSKVRFQSSFSFELAIHTLLTL